MQYNQYFFVHLYDNNMLTDNRVFQHYSYGY